ncbi:MAG TPA: hypothetical protein PK054_00520 [Anaerohalosphaeraceae bacterium]|nr:hypothetical protein [Anaerohalosphaeraceae bacterium]HOL88394.1 hypothetical protein [Anaerohalosphaeraceae bacterium]HPP55046.1 hypothetical protein [Anaerohalosphaeraceae bacterium]
MKPLWKANWPQTRQHFLDWWAGRGLVLGSWGTGLDGDGPLHEDVPQPAAAADAEQYHTDPNRVAERIHYEMAHKVWPADMLPVAWPDIGTVTLAPFLGAVPKYEKENIWYHPCIADPESHPPLRYNPDAPYSRMLKAVLRAAVARSGGHYFVGMPAIISNLDVLAAVRGTEDLLVDMLERPAWVHQKLQEIETAYRQVFDELYEILRDEDGGMAFGYFMLWGPGKTGLLQCDTAVMISPKMFDEFVVPYLKQSVEYLDYSMFHVDGHQCLACVDSLLAIEGLKAIEWTPDPQVPPGGSPHWYDLYKKILRAGKAVWAANLDAEEVIPLLDAVGPKGVYLTVTTAGGKPIMARQMEELADKIEPYRV